MPDVLRLEAVSKSYGHSAVVSDVSFAVGKGELCAIVGPSGCGKTTTLKMINRLIEPDAGRIFVDGRDAASVNAVLLRRRIGYVIQQVGLFPHMSVQDNVAAVLRITGGSRELCRRRAHEMLDLVGLPSREYATRRPSALSGGQQQRVGVARALAADPDLILMDEPFAAVDPVVRKQLQDELRRIQAETHKTIVFVTHDLPEAFSLADHIVVMQNGKVVQAGSPEELLFHPSAPFVSTYLSESRELLGLRFLQARTFGRPVTPCIAELPGDASVLEVIQALARRPASQRLQSVVLGGPGTAEHWLLEPIDLVRAIVSAVRKPA